MPYDKIQGITGRFHSWTTYRVKFDLSLTGRKPILSLYLDPYYYST
jgi:hypothetical protein